MSQTILHSNSSRGEVNLGWLHSRHTFSFGNYYNPERIHFGMLRVLNDDTVQPAIGFGTHPHDNMEIVSIPLEGDLQHQDSMGNVSVIRQGDIQVMSAGSGITHSEKNFSSHQPVKFLQIWVFPNQRNVAPRYDQLTLNPLDRINKWQQILSPDPNDEGVWIHQDAWFSIGKFDREHQLPYILHHEGNGVYAFVLNGSCIIESIPLEMRDGLGIWDTKTITFTSTSPQTEVLLMEVPMH